MITADSRFFLTGATGLLGRWFLDTLDATAPTWPQGHRHEIDHAQFVRVDLGDRESLLAELDRIAPDVIVHAAANASVDDCERRPADAYRGNVEATRTLVEWMSKAKPDGAIVYISSDQVYGGPGPHEEDHVDPSNVYAMTKLWGEEIVRQVPRALIARVNFIAEPHAPHHGGFVRWLAKNLSNGHPVSLFEDVQFNPLHGSQLVSNVMALIEKQAWGTYNLGARDFCSKAKLGRSIAAHLGLSVASATDSSVDNAGLSAERPKDMRMSTARAASVLGAPMPTLAEVVALIDRERALQ